METASEETVAAARGSAVFAARSLLVSLAHVLAVRRLPASACFGPSEPGKRWEAHATDESGTFSQKLCCKPWLCPKAHRPCWLSRESRGSSPSGPKLPRITVLTPSGLVIRRFCEAATDQVSVDGEAKSAWPEQAGSKLEVLVKRATLHRRGSD